VSFTGAGTCVIDANQLGNANYSAALQVQQSVTVTGSASGKTSLEISPENSDAEAIGSSVVFTAYVNVTSGHGHLSGAVTFYLNGVAVSGCQNVALTHDGQATCRVLFTSVGSFTVSATYGNDPNFGGSSDSTTQSVVKGHTSLHLSHSTSVTVGASVTYGATVTETSGTGPLTGNVSFTDNGVAVAGCQNVALVGATASCTVHFTTSGIFTIAATYANDPNFTGSSDSSSQSVTSG
jgi:hypothetical protein